MISIEYMLKKWLKNLILAFLILTTISLILSIWMPLRQSFRVIFGMAYILFLPGFCWSWVFWKSTNIYILERLVMSIILSVAIVPLMIYFLNRLGLKINLLNSFIEIGVLIIFALIIIYRNFNKSKINFKKNV